MRNKISAATLYKLNLTKEEQQKSGMYLFDYDEVEAKDYDATNGSGMCCGDMYSMLYRTNDDWYLMLYDYDDFKNDETAELKEAYNYIGIGEAFGRQTLVFSQEELCL